MDQKDTQDSMLGRWIAGDLSEAELKEFESRPDFEDLKRIVEGTDALEAPPFDEAASWSRLSARAGLDEEEDEGAEAVEIPLQRSSFMRRNRWVGVAIAASIALLVVIFLNLSGDQINETVTFAGENQRVELPDGSTVDLNAGSKLRFSESNWDEERKLQLEGEAFFEVATGQRFTVTTPTGSVEVLGTSFNVRARETGLQVACYTGKVRVVKAGGEEAGILEPGKGLALGLDGSMETFSFQDAAPGWKNGTFSYEGESFSSVADEVERQFGIELVYRGLEDKRFTGDFNKNNLKQALQSITIPYGYVWKELEKGKYELYMAE